MKCVFFLVLLIISFTVTVSAQEVKNDSIAPAPPIQRVEWYRKISIRGYTQIRYNRLFETNNELQCEQCDRSWGGNGGFFLRRIRIIFFGQVHERVYVYIQPDFASSPSSSNNNHHFAQIRDAYFDLGLDSKNQFRLRIGQSKVPFGFENLQSSQNRIPLDRNDALNSAVANERDLGVFFYWAPTKIRERFSKLVSSGLKGSGDYGVFGLGVYNGQTANRVDGNKEVHTVARISYPIEIGDQIIEPGVQGYAGKTIVSSRTSGVTGNTDFEYADERIAATFVLYPKPFGLTAEYNMGTGPEYSPSSNSIEQRKLKGGYIQASYLFQFGDQVIIPFLRHQRYDGGKKHELDARSYNVNETEIGFEWQPIKNFEFVAMYTISKRRFEDAVLNDNMQEGSLLRLHAQFNY